MEKKNDKGKGTKGRDINVAHDRQERRDRREKSI